jgi:hypothetical protein
MLLVPPAAFIAVVLAVQVALPSALFPSYPDQGFQGTDDMLRGPLPFGIATHLSFGADGFGWAFLVLGAAAVGASLRMIRHARRDAALLVFTVVALAGLARFPLNQDDRYYIQVLPFVLYFLAQLAPTTVELMDAHSVTASTPRRARAATGVALAVMSVLVLVQVWHLPAEVREAREFTSSGQVRWGPADPSMQAAFRAVERRTPPDAVVATHKARLLTMVTRRRAIQTADLALALERADYLLVLRESSLGEGLPTKKIAASRGLSPVWNDDTWVLWRNDSLGR